MKRRMEWKLISATIGIAIISVGIFVSCDQFGNRDLAAEAVRSFRDAEGFDQVYNWYADTTHSSLQFKTKHTAVHDVIGWFGRYRILMSASKFDFSDAKIEAMADLRSIVMPNMGMALNLQNEDHFNTAKYPLANYVSKAIWYEESTVKILGDMTIKDITKEILFTGSMNGFAHPQERGLPGFTINGKFSRFDFEIGTRDTLRPGNVPMIDDTIRFTANLRFYVEQ